MPTYEYHCEACKADLEIFQSMKDDTLTVCPKCNKKGKIHRLISGGAGLIFKGSGFYETDYKNKAASKSETPSESIPDSKKADSKPKKETTSST